MDLLISGIFLIGLFLLIRKLNNMSFSQRDSRLPSTSTKNFDKNISDKETTQKDIYHYKRIDALFSPSERSFYGVLNQAVAGRATIFGKVRVADIIKPTACMSKSHWQTSFNKISRKHFDFVLCNNQDLSVICVIELDDKSHLNEDRKDRDDFLVSACKSAKIPLIQTPAQFSYTLPIIKALVDPYIEPIFSDAEPSKDTAHQCPRCSSPLVERIPKKGENIGIPFLACSSFPKCRYAKKIESAANLSCK